MINEYPIDDRATMQIKPEFVTEISIITSVIYLENATKVFFFFFNMGLWWVKTMKIDRPLQSLSLPGKLDLACLS